MPGGQIRPNSVRIASSSGQAKLDEWALRTVASGAPFASPPNEMTATIEVAFDHNH
jgi:TonB family protein